MPAKWSRLRRHAALSLSLGVALAACSGADAGADPAPGPADDSVQPSAAAPTASDSFDLGVARVGARLAEAARGKTVAVLEFPNFQGQQTDLGQMVAERLTTALVQNLASTGRVVERNQVRQVLRETGLLQKEMTTAGAAEAGRLLGADLVVVGTAAVLDGRAVVSARAVDIADGSVAAADEFSTRAGARANAASRQVVAPPPPAPNPVEALLALPVVSTSQVGPLQAQGHACMRTGNNVLCLLTVYSSDMDTYVWHDSNDSGATDNKGNTRRLTLSVGRERPTEGEGSVVAGVATPFQVLIDGVPLSADTISRLVVAMNYRASGQNTSYGEAFVLRGLPIVRP